MCVAVFSDSKQEAQLSQKGRMMLHLVEYFAKLLMFAQRYLK